MALTSGARLGPYEIVFALGAGGMGEVYRARDTRLDRIVAIKVLPTHLADKPELRERFEREARTIASLSHPHICTLHDIGHQDGTDYLVMEYLEGETLAERLKKGPLPLDQVLQYAIEIADALDKAHRKGVTHRDLKPSNIMLTKSGAKLLDFGLAKLRQDAAPTTPLSELPTAKDAITMQGTILGTLQYMAPEQLEGKEADARTDIFAFGVVVYEMATGKKAFEGKSQASVIGAILKDDPPPISSLQPMTPPAFDRVVKKCMAKEAERRWQAASDICDELKWIAEGGSQATSVPIASAKGVPALGRRGLLVGGTAALLVAVIASLVAWNLKPAPPRPVTRTVITLPLGQQLAGFDYGSAVAISPDGAHLAYVATQGGIQQLYLRAMDSLEAHAIPNTEGASSPFFSPDGQWIGFFAGTVGTVMKRISINGGVALTLNENIAFGGSSAGAAWDTRGTITVGTSVSGFGLMQLPDTGGLARHLTGSRDVFKRWPEVLPGGKAVLFVSGNPFFSKVSVQSLQSGEQRDLIQGATYPRYAASGHLIYAQGGTLMAAPFDPQHLTVTGAALPVVDGVVQSPFSGSTQYSISGAGTLIYVPGSLTGTQRRLVWVDRDGKERPLAAPAGGYESPRLSPDGQRAAVFTGGQIWLYDLSRETLTRFTFEGSFNNRPVWTPDGKRIAYYSDKDGSLNIFWQLADGSGGLERLTTAPESIDVPQSFSPDGQLLAFHEAFSSTREVISVLRLRDRKVQPFLETRSYAEADPRFSPDGRWLAYMSDETGRFEVYVQAYPGPGGKWQVSRDGGTEPVWDRNGRELFYRNGKKIMAVDVTAQPNFALGNPRVLFEGPYVLATLPYSNYDVSPDGRRFLMVKTDEGQASAPSQIVVVQNWFEELKQKVPTGKK